MAYLHSGAGVRLTVNFFEAINRDVRVNLGGREAGVAEQILNEPELCAVIEQVRRV